MNPPLPATLIAGFGSGGQTQVIAALLRHKNAAEEWAVIAPAGLATGVLRAPNPAPPGVWFETVAPGCPCCTGLTPFSTGLTALLRRLRGRPVTRLLIEGGAEGHIGSVARLLQEDRFRQHLTLTRAVAVINPRWLDYPSPTAQAALLELAGAADALVASGWDDIDAAGRATFAAFAAGLHPAKPWTTLGAGEVDADFVLAGPAQHEPRAD